MQAKTSKQGFALVCVLWILAILTVLTLGFGRRTMLDYRATAFSLDHTKALYAAKGAVARGIAELQNKHVYDMLDNTAGRTSYRQKWAAPFDLLKTENSYFDTDGNGLHDDDAVTLEIRDEQSRLSIIAAPEAMLATLPGLDPTTLRTIMATRDVTQGNPAPFLSIDEIRRLDGISDEAWFGNEQALGLCHTLTCCGDGRININTAPPEVLNSIPGIDPATIAAIIAYRNGTDRTPRTADDMDFGSITEIVEKTGASEQSIIPLQQYCNIDSSFFTITGIATMRQGNLRATCSATVQLSDGNVQILAWREDTVE